MFNEGNQIHNFMSSSGSGTAINYGSGSGSVFLTRTVPVPVPLVKKLRFLRFRFRFHNTALRLPPFHFDADPDPAFHFWCGFSPSYPFWCWSGSSFPTWCGSGSATLRGRGLKRSGWSDDGWQVWRGADAGSVLFLTLDPGSGIGFSGSRIPNPIIFDSLMTNFWVKGTTILIVLAKKISLSVCKIIIYNFRIFMATKNSRTK